MRLGPPELRHESEDFYVGHTLNTALHALLVQARLELNYNARHEPRPASEIDQIATNAVRQFADALPGLRRLLDSDVLAAYQGDPAARSVDEVLLCYPGVLAMPAPPRGAPAGVHPDWTAWTWTPRSPPRFRSGSR